MPEDVTIREDLQVIQVTSHGTITKGDFEASLDALLRIRDEQGLTRVFVDATKVTSYPSTMSIFDFGLKAAGAIRGIRLAIATPPGIRDDPAFFENVMRNRGGSVRVFDSPDAALMWLTKEPNNPLEAPPSFRTS